MASLHGREVTFEDFTRAGVVAPMASNRSQRLPPRSPTLTEPTLQDESLLAVSD